MHIARDNGPSYEESIGLDFGIGFSLVGLVILAVVDQFLGGRVLRTIKKWARALFGM